MKHVQRDSNKLLLLLCLVCPSHQCSKYWMVCWWGFCTAWRSWPPEKHWHMLSDDRISSLHFFLSWGHHCKTLWDSRHFLTRLNPFLLLVTAHKPVSLASYHWKGSLLVCRIWPCHSSVPCWKSPHLKIPPFLFYQHTKYLQAYMSIYLQAYT